MKTLEIKGNKWLVLYESKADWGGVFEIVPAWNIAYGTFEEAKEFANNIANEIIKYFNGYINGKKIRHVDSILPGITDIKRLSNIDIVGSDIPVDNKPFWLINSYAGMTSVRQGSDGDYYISGSKLGIRPYIQLMLEDPEKINNKKEEIINA